MRIQSRVFTNGKDDGRVLVHGEAGAAIDGQLVLTGRHPHQVVTTVFVGDDRALCASPGVGQSDLRALDGEILRVEHSSGKRGGIDALRGSPGGTYKRQQTEQYRRY